MKLNEKYLNIDKLINDIKEERRYLHQIPEIGFDLKLTTTYIKKILDEYNIFYETIVNDSIIVYFKGELKESIAIRADMDALLINECNEIPYKSKHNGHMHACGHDGHMTILLELAKILSKSKLKKSVVLIFQPGEESPGGAKPIVDSNIFSKYNVKNTFGLHLTPNIPIRKIGVHKGYFLSSVSMIDISVNGLSSHGSAPNEGIDSIVIASNLITTIQTVISRNISPLDSAVITFSSINGGSYNSIICDKVVIHGTIRTFDSQTKDIIVSRIENIIKGVEITYQTTINCKIVDFYPAVKCDSELYDLIVPNLDKDDYLVVDKQLFSEDFSFYQEVTSCFFVLLGINDGQKGTYSLHNERFDFNEEALITGIKYFYFILELFGTF